MDVKNEENNSVLAGRSLLLSSQFFGGCFDPFPSFLRPATQANYITAPCLNKNYIAPDHQNLAGEFYVVVR